MPTPSPSKLDLQQILQRVFDEEAGKLRTDTTATIGDIAINVDLVPSADGVYIADKDTGNKLKINDDGSITFIPVVAGTPLIQNISIPIAQVQTPIVLPSNTKKFLIKIKDYESGMKLAFQQNASDLLTISRGCSYSEDNLSLTTIYRIIYLQSTKNNVVVECISWA